MKLRNRTLTIFAILFLLISPIGIVVQNQLVRVFALNGAELTGNITDSGSDVDGSGEFDYLVIAVEVNVSTAGYYEVYAEYLEDRSFRSLSFSIRNMSYLEEGLQWVILKFHGPTIRGENFDPASVSWIDLSQMNDYLYYLDSIYDIPLSRIYNYTEFDLAAKLTGTIFDVEIDDDGDSLLDYLEIGIEINVTEEGTYEAYVERLSDGNISVYLYDSSTIFLTAGVHRINVTLDGQEIFSEFHPMKGNFSYVSISISVEDDGRFYHIDHLWDQMLSRTYTYKEFEHPFKEMGVKITVFPEGFLIVDGNFSHRQIYPPRFGPQSNNTITFSTLGNTTTGMFYNTLQYSGENLIWPVNSTVIQSWIEYQDGLLTSQMNGTLSIPSMVDEVCPFSPNSSDLSLTAEFSDGLVSVDMWGSSQLCHEMSSEFPFNISDATVIADYLNEEITGNITYHTIAGFPLADVIIYFNGSLNELTLNGHINVIYGNYSGLYINSTILDEMLNQFNSTIPGQEEGSFYNMTGNTIECTSLNTTTTPIGPPDGARIDYDAKLQGSFIEFLAKMLSQMFGNETESYPLLSAALNATIDSIQDASFHLNFYNTSKIVDFTLTLTSDVKELWKNALDLIPPTIPIEQQTQVESLLEIANITAYAVDHAYLEATYSGDQQKLMLNKTLTANLTHIEAEAIPLISSIAPPEMQEIIESYFNTSYCNIESFLMSSNFTYGTGSSEANVILKGDFKRQINHTKNIFIVLLNVTDPIASQEWQAILLNMTEIDVSNFTAYIGQGEDWDIVNFEGLKLYPIKEEIDFIRFKLHDWLNLTSGPDAPPQEFEKLTLTLTSGFNGTHTILLHRPVVTPLPDLQTLDYKTMTWDNVTISALKDILFKVAYQKVIDYLGAPYYVPIFTNSTVENFNFNPTAKRISFNVTGKVGSGFFNITIPRALLYAAEDEWTVRIDGMLLDVGLGEFQVSENAEYAFLYMNYSHSNHLIEIEGTWVVTEFPAHILLLTLIIMGLASVIIIATNRNRIRIFKTRFQREFHTFVRRFLHLGT